MSKNLSRKGLALGAIVALAASFFGGTAAFAADEVTLQPLKGTLTKTISGESFALLSGLAPSVPASNVVNLKYEVVTSTDIANVAFSSVNNGAATSRTSSTVGAAANTYIYTAGGPSAGSTQGATIQVSNVAAGTPVTATVVAFLDSTPDSLRGAGEWASAPVTITWVNVADVTTKLTVTAPLAGDKSVKATVEYVGLNAQQLTAGYLGVTFSNNSTYAPFGATNGATIGATATVAASTGIATAATGTLTQGAVKGDLVKAQATYNGTAIGDSVLVAATARSIATISVAGDVAAGVVTGTKGTATTTSSTGGAVVVKTGNDFTVVATFKDASATPVAVSGVAVEATVTFSGTLTVGATSSTTATINGTEINSNTKLPGYSTSYPALALTTDANGQVKVSFKTSGVVAGQTFTVVFASQNFSARTVVTQEDSSYKVYDAADKTGTHVRTITAKGTYAADFRVLDQFGVAPADSTYRLAITATTGALTGTVGATVAGSRTTNATFAYYPAVTAGKAAQAIVDNGTGTGSTNVSVYLQKVGSDGNYSNVGTVANTFKLVVASTSTPAKVTLGTQTIESFGTAHVRVDATDDADTADSEDVPTVLRLNPNTFGSYDNRLDITGTAPSLNSASYGALVTAVVSLSDVGTTVVAGAPVTVSATGLQFSTGSVYGVDSLSFLSDSNGAVSFQVYSHKAGEQTITVASGTELQP